MTFRVELAAPHLVLTDEQRPIVADPVERLVAQAQTGDAGAFAALVSRFERKVLNTTWRLLGDRDDAMDAAQETFLRAYKYLGAYRGPEFGAWLYRIAVNVGRDAARRRRPVPDPGPPEVVEQPTDAGETRAQIERALGALTERERAVFVMRDLDGRATEEVARLLGSSAVTVRVHLCAARKKVRQFLAAAEAREAEEGE